MAPDELAANICSPFVSLAPANTNTTIQRAAGGKGLFARSSVCLFFDLAGWQADCCRCFAQLCTV